MSSTIDVQHAFAISSARLGLLLHYHGPSYNISLLWVVLQQSQWVYLHLCLQFCWHRSN